MLKSETILNAVQTKKKKKNDPEGNMDKGAQSTSEDINGVNHYDISVYARKYKIYRQDNKTRDMQA